MNILIDNVTTKQFEMKFLRFGHGEKNLVIIPGLSVQSVMGAAQQIADSYALMADDFTVYVFDRRLDLPPKYSISDMAEDTVQALCTIGLRDIYLFGASQGGMIALEIAIRHPALVKKLALGSVSPDMRNHLPPVLHEWIRLAEEKDKQGLYLSFGEKIYPSKVFLQCKDALIAASNTVTDDDLARFIILARGMEGFFVTPSLYKIQCPVLLIGSYDDQVLDPAMTMEIAKQLGAREDFEIFMYRGFGHAAFDTAPDYREKLYRFFMK